MALPQRPQNSKKIVVRGASSAEKNYQPNSVKPAAAGVKFRVLAIDGGGIRGIIPATILQQVEQTIREQTKNSSARLVDYFDMICGTSTGGILSMMYLLPTIADKDEKLPNTSDAESKEAPGMPQDTEFTTTDAVNLYVQNGANIFGRPWTDVLKPGRTLFYPKYSNETLKALLERKAGGAWISELIKPCVVPVYDIERETTVFLCSTNDGKPPLKDYRIVDVALGTSAAPTYFPSHEFDDRAKRFTINAIDGGVTANNPAMLGWTGAVSLGFDLVNRQLDIKEIAILSLGTGRVAHAIHVTKEANWGLAAWGPVFINMMFDANSSAIDTELSKLYKGADVENQYLRIQPVILQEHSKLDDASEDNIHALQVIGEAAVRQHRVAINRFVQQFLLPMGPRNRLTERDYAQAVQQ